MVIEWFMLILWVLLLRTEHYGAVRVRHEATHTHEVIHRGRPCLNDCSSQLPGERGVCVDGSCVCEEMFAGLDCSIDLIPEIPEEIEIKSEDSEELLLAATCTEDSCLESCTYGGKCIDKFTCKCEPVASSSRSSKSKKKKEEKEDTMVTLSDSDSSSLLQVYRDLGQKVPSGDACGGGNVDVTCDDTGRVAELHFERRNIRTSFPGNSVKMLSNLRVLSLSNNEITGTIVPNFCVELSHVEHLFLYRNKLTGMLPKSIGMCRDLVSLVAYGNRFTGTLPDSLFDLRRLRMLDLSFNSFTGLISSKIDHLINLESLYLNHNNFQGQLPKTLNGLWNIQTIRLEDNPRLRGNVIKMSLEEVFTDSLYDMALGDTENGLQDVQRIFMPMKRSKNKNSWKDVWRYGA